MPLWTHPAEFRREVRTGRYRAQTAGQCPGYTQGNLALLPRECSEEFLRFAHLNPKSCPLIAVTEPGGCHVPALGDIDLRTDLPAYWILRDGQEAEPVHDLSGVWRDDLVGFVIGCSYSFEDALRDAGVPVRHIDEGRAVPMFISSIPNGQAGRFGGHMVVSMRPMAAAQAIRAVQVTSRFPSVHGAPVHLGDPAQIGIADIGRPDFGEPVALKPGEIPVFWACGVTPQQAIRSAALPFAIVHAPGHMLVTDLRNSHLAAF